MQAKTGNQKEFQIALQTLRGKGVDISEESTEIKVLLLNPLNFDFHCLCLR